MKNENLDCCRICFSNKLTSYLDLGKQPFSNSFLNYKDLKNEKKFPLEVVLCKNCGLSQLSIVPNTKFIFNKYDYLSSSSKALSNHYKELVETLLKIPKLLRFLLALRINSLLIASPSEKGTSRLITLSLVLLLP